MSRSDLAAFRRMCAQYRWLSIVMIVTAGGVVALAHVIFPSVGFASGRGPASDWRIYLGFIIWASPLLCYFLAVWIIGQAMGRLSRGGLLQPTLARALRRAGLSLGVGGVLSVFGVMPLMRLIDSSRGGLLYFDVPGMTLGMVGGALFLLGRVMDQAGRVQAELNEII